MRIIHFSTARTWRGGEQQIAYLVGELQNEPNIEQWIFCCKGSAMEAYCTKQGLRFVSFRKFFSFNLLVSWQFARFCRQYAIDIAHLHDPHAHNFAVIAADLFGNASVPLILSRRVDFPLRKNAYTLYKYHHRSVERILCVSEAIKDIMMQDFRFPEKLRRVYSGVDINRFASKSAADTSALRQEYGVSEHRVLIGNTAALAAHKGYDTFIEVARLLTAWGIDAHFFIIGSGNAAPYREQIERYGLNERFTITGFRNDIDMVLPQLDVFLMPSRTEGLGTSVIDAFAAGVVVVASDVGGIPELVIDNETGLLAPVGDADAFAHRVAYLLQNPTEAERLCKSARTRAMLFDKKHTAQQTLKEYRAVLAKTNR